MGSGNELPTLEDVEVKAERYTIMRERLREYRRRMEAARDE